MAYDEAPKIHVSIEQSVNLGNFQSAKVSMGVSQLPFDADADMIERALLTQQLAFTMLKTQMREKIASVRKENGFD